METDSYKKHYSESGLWEKLKSQAKAAGKTLVGNALKLYYAMALKKANPVQVAAIIGALGYFISPVDAILDMLPGGYVDDASILAATVSLLACCADKEVKAAAKRKASEWFD